MRASRSTARSPHGPSRVVIRSSLDFSPRPTSYPYLLPPPPPTPSPHLAHTSALSTPPLTHHPTPPCSFPCSSSAYSGVAKQPRRPFEKERLDSELKIVGEYGLKNKRELWRIQLALSKIRKAARTMLTLDENDTRRIFEGNALLRRLTRYGLLAEDKRDLDSVLSMQATDFLDRRLQTVVARLGLAKSVHHARVLIKQGHIRVGKQIVNVASFLVRVDSERHIDFAVNSAFGGGRPGRNKRRSIAAKKGKGGGDDDE